MDPRRGRDALIGPPARSKLDRDRVIGAPAAKDDAASMAQLQIGPVVSIGWVAPTAPSVDNIKPAATAWDKNLEWPVGKMKGGLKFSFYRAAH